MPSRKSIYTLDSTPITVKARILIGDDGKTFYVMSRGKYGWKKIRFTGEWPPRYETHDYEEAIKLLEKELCKVISKNSALCLSVPVYKYDKIKLQKSTV